MLGEYLSGNLPDFTANLEKVGRWQVIHFLLLTTSNLSVAFTSLGILLIGYQPPFRCASPLWSGNGSNKEQDFDDVCSVTNTTANESISCPYGYEYEGGKDVSVVSEWDLICDYDYLAELAQTFYVLGMVVGANVVSHLADRFGRKPLLLLSGCAATVFFLALAFVPNIAWFTCLRFAIGFCNLGFYDMKAVLILEMFPIRWRATMIILDGLSWGIAITVLACLDYPLTGMDWRYVQLILLSSFGIMIVYFVFIDESVRWLVANGRNKEAVRILRKIKRINRIPATSSVQVECENWKIIEGEDPKETVSTDPDGEVAREKKRLFQFTLQEHNSGHREQVVKYNVLDILKHRQTRLVLLIMCLVWFTDSLIYLGLFLMTTAMSGDRLLNVLLSAAAEIPAMAGLYVCMRWLGRRRGCIGLHLACAVALLLSLVFSLTTEGHINDVLMKIVSFIGKFSISASFILIYFYTPELLPTNFRAAGLGMASGAARFGSALAPFSSFVFRKAPWAPGAVFGGLSLLVSLLLMFIPETKDKELPQHLEDIDQWDAANKDATKAMIVEKKPCIS